MHLDECRIARGMKAFGSWSISVLKGMQVLGWMYGCAKRSEGIWRDILVCYEV